MSMAAIPTTTEIPLKEWRHQEAARLGVSPSTVAHYMSWGRYRHLKLRRVNKRVVFVIEEVRRA